MPKKHAAELVPPESYKPLLPKARQAAALAMLKSSETLARANRVFAMKAGQLRIAVLDLIAAIEQAAKDRDWGAAVAAAHEIRGLAGNAGLASTGRIANGFCNYVDAYRLHKAEPDMSVAALHVDAIVRSARIVDDAARHGDAVAEQLAALVRRKLADIKD